MKIEVFGPETVTGQLYKELNVLKDAGDVLPRIIDLTAAEYAQLTAEDEGDAPSSFFGLPLSVDGERVKSAMELFAEQMRAAQAETAGDLSEMRVIN